MSLKECLADLLGLLALRAEGGEENVQLLEWALKVTWSELRLRVKKNTAHFQAKRGLFDSLANWSPKEDGSQVPAVEIRLPHVVEAGFYAKYGLEVRDRGDGCLTFSLQNDTIPSLIQGIGKMFRDVSQIALRRKNKIELNRHS
ncbi:hypothetical protein LXA43DRAFT_1105238 [Ganoderma leucocontextum]|nr:hypothetical protein LXA43DRAFT_1105238 [Ganoderma leucocontextum]